MIDPDYGNSCYYYKDGYKWHCLGNCTFHDFGVVIDVEDNCLSFYFGISYCIPLLCMFLLRYHWDFLINSISIVFCVIVSHIYIYIY